MFLLCGFCLKSCYCTGVRGRVNSQPPSSRQLFNFNREKHVMKGQQKQRKDSLIAEAQHRSHELGLFGQFLALTLTSFMCQANHSVSLQLWWKCPPLGECGRLSHWIPSPEPKSSLSPTKRKWWALSAEVPQLSPGELLCLFEMNCSCDYSPHVPMRLHRAPAASVVQPWVIWRPLYSLIRQPDIFPAFMLKMLQQSPAREDPVLQSLYTNLVL